MNCMHFVVQKKTCLHFSPLRNLFTLCTVRAYFICARAENAGSVDL